jgi:hypothetical protein
MREPSVPAGPSPFRPSFRRFSLSLLCGSLLVVAVGGGAPAAAAPDGWTATVTATTTYTDSAAPRPAASAWNIIPMAPLLWVSGLITPSQAIVVAPTFQGSQAGLATTFTVSFKFTNSRGTPPAPPTFLLYSDAGFVNTERVFGPYASAGHDADLLCGLCDHNGGSGLAYPRKTINTVELVFTDEPFASARGTPDENDRARRGHSPRIRDRVRQPHAGATWARHSGCR